jgi:hypothetical protein
MRPKEGKQAATNYLANALKETLRNNDESATPRLERDCLAGGFRH